MYCASCIKNSATENPIVKRMKQNRLKELQNYAFYALFVCSHYFFNTRLAILISGN